MLEIKFRGKSAFDGRWLYGYFLIDKHGRNCIYNKGISEAIIAGTEGQYIGLQDKNGKEIYEGDVIKLQRYEGEKETNYEIEVVNDICYKPTDYLIINGIHQFEVIGNKFENPELLK